MIYPLIFIELITYAYHENDNEFTDIYSEIVKYTSDQYRNGKIKEESIESRHNIIDGLKKIHSYLYIIETKEIEIKEKYIGAIQRVHELFYLIANVNLGGISNEEVIIELTDKDINNFRTTVHFRMGLRKF